MRRLLLVWSALFPAFLAATFATNALVFRSVDLRYPAFVDLVAVPAFQAAVVAALTRPKDAAPVLPLLLRSLAVPPVALLLGLEAALLLAGLAWPLHAVVGLKSGVLPPAWAGVQGLAAAALLLLLAARPGTAARGRAPLALYAAGLLAYALDPFLPWLERLPPRVLYGRSLLWKWLATYGVLFALAVAATLLLARALERRSTAAGLHADGAVAAMLLASAVVVLNVFLRPEIVDPWRAVVHALSSLAATFVLTAAVLAARGAPGRAP